MNPPSQPRSLLDEAADPATPPQRLKELSRYRGTVARAVATNPNTPIPTLLWLCRRHAAEVFANPVLPLAVLEDPGLPLRLPKNVIWEMLRDPEIPAHFLAAFERHPDADIRGAARGHRQRGERAPTQEAKTPAAGEIGTRGIAEAIRVGLAPDWLLRQAMESGSRLVRQLAWDAVCAGKNAELRRHAELLQRAGARVRLRAMSKGDPKIDPADLARLAEGGPFARQLAARHRATPPEALQRIAADPATPPAVRRYALINPNAPAAVLLEAAMSSDKRVRAAAASHPAASPSALDRLAADPEAYVRRRAARHRATPETTLVRLVADPDPEVRAALAGNAAASEAILEKLLADPVRDVREALARRAGCPAAILLRLAGQDPDRYVRMRAVDNRALPGDPDENRARFLLPVFESKEIPDIDPSQPVSAEEADRVASLARARNREADPAALAALATHPSTDVRRALAENQKTPAEALRLLAKDGEASVRQRLACNYSVSSDVMRLLANDAADEVRFAAAQNPNTPPECLEEMIAKEPPAIRARVVFNKAAPPELLDRIARTDDSKEVRDALFNPHVKLSEATLRWLFENTGRNPEEWGRDERTLITWMAEIMERIPHQWSRGHVLFSNGFHRRRKGTVPAIPAEALLASLKFPDDQYNIHRNKMVIALAEYWATPPEVLRHCAEIFFSEEEKSSGGYRRRAASWETRRHAGPLAAIARAHACPPDLLARLAQSRHPNVRLAALCNPALPPEARETRRAALIAEGAKSSAATLRLCALSHPDTPAAQLRERAWKGRWSERFAIAGNPSCPRDILAFLCEDADSRVRDVARAKFRERFADGFLAAPPAPGSAQ